jgi:hypothetical protein
LTALPGIGEIIERNESLFEVDGRTVPLLYGTRPMWRTLGPGVDDGADVREVEENLVALGMAPGLHADDHWTAATTAAVKRWQRQRGETESGVMTPSDAVFLPGPVRVATHEADVGAMTQPGGQPVLTVTGTTRLVNVRLDAAKQSLAHAGDTVRVDLPGGAQIDGTIFSVGAVASVDDSQQGGDSTARVDVTIVLRDSSKKITEGLDQTPVAVELTRSAARNVLAVPVGALTALSEGGYAVEVVDHATTHLVRVDVGTYADGWAQITGDVAAGTRVVVPS